MISAVILTFNSQNTIRTCLTSLNWVDNLLVIDSGSTDQTLTICQELGSSIQAHPYKNYGDQLNFALTLVKTKWVLVVDSDEYVTEELTDAIRTMIKEPGEPRFKGFKIPRKSFFLNKPILHGGWYPDYVLRLFMVTKAHYKERELGSSPVIQGEIGKLKGDLIHHPYDTLDAYLRKFNRYADAWAREMHKQGKKCRLLHLLLWPPARFIKMYLLQAGFLDGLHGFILSSLTAFYVLTKYLKLYEYQVSGLPET